MNRKERQLTERNLKDQKKKLKELRETYQHDKDVLYLNKEIRDLNQAYSDKWGKIMNKKSDKAGEFERETQMETIENLKFTIKSTEEQLK